MIRNNLLVLKILDRYPMKMINAETTGLAPTPRLMHTMSLFIELGMMVIAGGKNDNLRDNSFFNDMFVLDLYKLQWIGVNQMGDVLEPRAAHCASAFSENIGFNKIKI